MLYLYLLLSCFSLETKDFGFSRKRMSFLYPILIKLQTLEITINDKKKIILDMFQNVEAISLNILF